MAQAEAVAAAGADAPAAGQGAGVAGLDAPAVAARLGVLSSASQVGTTPQGPGRAAAGSYASKRRTPPRPARASCPAALFLLADRLHLPSTAAQGNFAVALRKFEDGLASAFALREECLEVSLSLADFKDNPAGDAARKKLALARAAVDEGLKVAAAGQACDVAAQLARLGRVPPGACPATPGACAGASCRLCAQQP